MSHVRVRSGAYGAGMRAKARAFEEEAEVEMTSAAHGGATPGSSPSLRLSRTATSGRRLATDLDDVDAMMEDELTWWEWLLEPDQILSEGNKTGVHALWYIVESRLFRYFIGVTIAVTTVLVGVQVDLGVVVEEDLPWLIIESIVTAIFVIEAILKILAYSPWVYFRDSWHLFDFFITVATGAGLIASVTGAERTNSIAAAVALRALRLVRIARVLRSTSMIRSLAELMRAVSTSLKAVFWAFLLYLLINYSVSVLTTAIVGRSDLYKGQEREDIQRYYGTVPRSMYSYWQIMTLESWSAVMVRPILEKQPEFAVLVCVPYVALTSFLLVSLIGAIFTDRLMQVSEEEKEKRLAERALERRSAGVELLKALQAIDKDDSGAISGEELRQVLRECDKMERIERMRSVSAARAAAENRSGRRSMRAAKSELDLAHAVAHGSVSVVDPPSEARAKELSLIRQALDDMDISEAELFDSAHIIQYASQRVFASVLPDLSIKVIADEAEAQTEEVSREDIRQILRDDVAAMEDAEHEASSAEQELSTPLVHLPSKRASKTRAPPPPPKQHSEDDDGSGGKGDGGIARAASAESGLLRSEAPGVPRSKSHYSITSKSSSRRKSVLDTSALSHLMKRRTHSRESSSREDRTMSSHEGDGVDDNIHGTGVVDVTVEEVEGTASESEDEEAPKPKKQTRGFQTFIGERADREREVGFRVLVQGLLSLKAAPTRKDVLLLSAQISMLREMMEVHMMALRQTLLSESARIRAETRATTARAVNRLREEIIGDDRLD